MRLRTEIEAAPMLLKIVQSMARIGPLCVIHFAPDAVRLITISDTDGVQYSVQGGDLNPSLALSEEIFFHNYLVQSKYHDQVNLEVHTDMLVSALKSAVDAESITMRLGKRGASPHLAFSILADVNAPGSKDGNRTKVEIQHEVLIRLMKPQDWETFNEPHIQRPPVSIELPKLSKLRTVTERLMRMSFTHIRLAANKEGVLNVGSSAEKGSIQVIWENLKNMPTPAIPGADQEDPSEYHEIVMDIRPFMRFLASHSVESTTAAIVLPEECAVFLVHVGDRSQGTVMAFFIPAAYDF